MTETPPHVIQALAQMAALEKRVLTPRSAPPAEAVEIAAAKTDEMPLEDAAAAVLGGFLDASHDIAQLREELARLRKLVRAAYGEGFRDGIDRGQGAGGRGGEALHWARSNARYQLERTEA